jgi:hypothetical protein
MSKFLIQEILEKEHPVHIITGEGEHGNETCVCNPKIEIIEKYVIIWHENMGANNATIS